MLDVILFQTFVLKQPEMLKVKAGGKKRKKKRDREEKTQPISWTFFNLGMQIADICINLERICNAVGDDP